MSERVVVAVLVGLAGLIAGMALSPPWGTLPQDWRITAMALVLVAVGALLARHARGQR